MRADAILVSTLALLVAGCGMLGAEEEAPERPSEADPIAAVDAEGEWNPAQAVTDDDEGTTEAILADGRRERIDRPPFEHIETGAMERAEGADTGSDDDAARDGPVEAAREADPLGTTDVALDAAVLVVLALLVALLWTGLFLLPRPAVAAGAIALAAVAGWAVGAFA